VRPGGGDWLVVAALFVGYCAIFGLLMWLVGT
jgi:hypothetical protein